MNTRLQVEHPVTELVTGLDLVEEMIRIAAGEKLRFTQSDVRLNGWAIEARIYAEDPFREFLPSIGRLTRYRPPPKARSDGATIRVDAGVVEGSEISLFYDPMIAKLCTHAPDRAAAIDAMADALDAFAIDGIRHNIPFLAALMAHPRWREGRLSTAFIAQEFPGGFHGVTPDAAEKTVLAAIAVSAEFAAMRRPRPPKAAKHAGGGRQRSWCSRSAASSCRCRSSITHPSRLTRRRSAMRPTSLGRSQTGGRASRSGAARSMASR